MVFVKHENLSNQKIPYKRKTNTETMKGGVGEIAGVYAPRCCSAFCHPLLEISVQIKLKPYDKMASTKSHFRDKHSSPSNSPPLLSFLPIQVRFIFTHISMVQSGAHCTAAFMSTSISASVLIEEHWRDFWADKSDRLSVTTVKIKEPICLL